MDIGIKEQDRKDIAQGLSHLLADTYTLYLKTHYFHWNVTGPMFNTLHLMFEGQYTELALAVDLVAERIRSLDVYAPGTYRDFVKLSSIKESESVPKAQDMITELVAGHEAVCRTARRTPRLARATVGCGGGGPFRLCAESSAHRRTVLCLPCGCRAI